MYGLTINTIQSIITVFIKYPVLEKAILYGSRAKGNYKTGSDIDLMLEGENLDLTILQKIENDLDDLLLPYKMDVSLLRHIQNPELLDHIRRVGIIFYKKETN